MADNVDIDLDSVIDRLLEGPSPFLWTTGVLLICWIASFYLSISYAPSTTPPESTRRWRTTTHNPIHRHRQRHPHMSRQPPTPLPSNLTRLTLTPHLTPKTVRGNRPGKPVQLAEFEIKYLCTKAREIFINQPILLELEAPIKICGELTFV